MSINKSTNLTYEQAGVNITAGDELVHKLKAITKSTHRKGVLGGIGGFGALFELPLDRYQNPVLVSGTDGVGTKLKLALMLNKHNTIGIDLVAMCVNDIVVSGAEPLFFLDYFATGKLNPERAAEIIEGIAHGCKQANCALVGGETAEMPGMYHGDDYDLAGFSVGIVEKNKIIDGSKIKKDDCLIALASSGAHSNGYSLIRKILEINNIDINSDQNLGEMLLTPTKIYVATILSLIQKFNILGIAHITGGGITENLPRILAKHLGAKVDLNSWKFPELFTFLQNKGNIEHSEMLRTFNCGVGMIICVSQNDCQPILKELEILGEHAWKIGTVCERLDDTVIQYV